MNGRGSVWSKWDLHIHTPHSIYNKYGGDKEEVWEKFITSLEELPKEVKVIGINDYYFIDGFEKVMEYKYGKGRLANIEKIFPILEFRIDTFASASESKLQKINFHILFDINDSVWKEEVRKIKEEFINLIKISRLPEHDTKILSKENFARAAGTLQKGFDNLVPSTDEVLKYVNSETWKEKVFTFVGYKEWSNLDKKQQLKPYKENIFAIADAFFTASPSDNVENKQQLIEQFGNKPILHSSDIHKFELFGDNYKCYTWIKAEPSFEGLKQILFEQSQRLKIQDSNPEYEEQKQMVIDSVKINNSNGWFGSEELVLNRGLISIIGEKGAGKTALLDILAVSNDEGIYEQDIKNPYSFYNRAKELLKNTEINIKVYGSEAVNKVVLNGGSVNNYSNTFGKVRYLSLKELESYCDDKEKLQNFIKNIINSKFPETEKYDVESKALIRKINDINIKIKDLISQTDGYDDLQKQIDAKKSALEITINSEPIVKTSFSKEESELYKELLTRKEILKSSLEKINNQRDKLVNIKDWVDTKLIELAKMFNDELSDKGIGLDEDIKSEILKLNLEIKVSNIDVLQNKITEVDTYFQTLSKERKQLDSKIEPLEELNKSCKNENEIIRKWIEQKKQLEDDIEKLNSKLKRIDEIERNINIQVNNRSALIKKLLINKLEQKKKYFELKTILEADNHIKFDVSIEFDDEKIFLNENERVNHNMGNSPEVIKRMLNENYINKVRDLTEDTLESIVNFLSNINEQEFIKTVFGSNRDKKNLMKKSYTIADFYNILYDDYYNVNYLIKFKNRQLQLLSPGQKGLVLMKIFLKLDESNKPLLIDQPEDNLDNKSVYNDLVNDLKTVKKNRQIIMATHNPNLVINTDSEQVIIASFEESEEAINPKITYQSGALENVKIKKLVCDILEGGDVAFMKREKRYNIKR